MMAGATKVGNQRVLVSGVVISRADEPVEIILESLVITINFKSDGTANAPHYGREASADGTKQTVTLTNFKNPLGTAHRDEIADLNGKPVFLTLFVHSIPVEPITRSIAYSLSTEGAR